LYPKAAHAKNAPALPVARRALPVAGNFARVRNALRDDGNEFRNVWTICFSAKISPVTATLRD